MRRNALSLAVLLVVASASVLHAQDAPTLKLPTMVFLAGAALDTVSTNAVLRLGGSEDNPALRFLHSSPTGVLATSIVLDSATLLLTHKIKVHHPRLASVTLYSLGGARLYFGARNLSRYTAYVNRFPPKIPPAPMGRSR